MLFAKVRCLYLPRPMSFALLSGNGGFACAVLASCAGPWWRSHSWWPIRQIPNVHNGKLRSLAHSQCPRCSRVPHPIEERPSIHIAGPLVGTLVAIAGAAPRQLQVLPRGLVADD